MGEKIIVVPTNRGLRNDRTQFVIDNDSFPQLVNAYQWRGRVKRKRGTSILGRLQRFFNSTSPSYNPSAIVITLDAGGNGNLLSGYSLQVIGNIVPGSVTIVDTVTSITYLDTNKDGTLLPSGSINYATGAIIIMAAANDTISAEFDYYPDLPVMGIEDLALIPTEFPGTLAFDTTYSYNISTAMPYPIYDVSFYKNPAVSASLPGYTPKTNPTPTTWNGQNYQQFWTTNYQGALWATNGINVPFSITNIGMQFSGVTNVAAPIGNTVQITVTGPNLVVGDFVFLNEFDPGTIEGINFQSGYITAGSSPGVITVTLPNATLTGAGGATILGIVQYLTNRSNTTKDCLRWYDGDPTNGNSSMPTLVEGNGWVNFAPPLSQFIFSIADLPQAQYYLVGARMIVPLKDRLLFLGAVIQSSGSGPFYLQDTIICSQNGTPYYTASFTGNPVFFDTVFTPILVPANQTATAPAYFEDQTGFGYFFSAGISQPIITVSSNEDVLIVGFGVSIQTRVIYSGNDLRPFDFYIINSELGSASTFSAVNMDQGVITRGSRGFIITSQTQSQRIDLEVPDEVFELNLTNNGNERVCATRDFINEWIYFTYPVNTSEQGESSTSLFPNQTLFYNYRDNTWAQFEESYTTYGAFRRQTGFIWSTVGMVYPTWSEWNDPWNAGESTLLQQEVIAGNQQGFIVFRDDGTGEANSLYIQSFSADTVTSPYHNLNQGDYIQISGAVGSVGSVVNGKIFSVNQPTLTTFKLNPDPGIGALTYFGGGLMKKLYVPFIQTKQFPVAWEMARKTRLGPQQYLFTTTPNSQITLLIYLSQNDSSAYNNSAIVPNPLSTNNSLIYSTVLFTCPESTNLGLTPANTNLNLITAPQQQQIWHRMNTSLLGDTVQIGFTLSDSQMRAFIPSGTAFAITGASQSNPCVLNCLGAFEAGQTLQITGVIGMTELNFNPTIINTYEVITSNAMTVTINVDSTLFMAYVSGGLATPVDPIYQTAEIELHSFILDVNPSQMLA
jgi:hypothetical protein